MDRIKSVGQVIEFYDHIPIREFYYASVYRHIRLRRKPEGVGE
jgi:hypothetical protein